MASNLRHNGQGLKRSGVGVSGCTELYFELIRPVDIINN